MTVDPLPGTEHSPYALAQSDIATWQARGLPRDKLVLGMPFYGLGFNGYAESYSFAGIVLVVCGLLTRAFPKWLAWLGFPIWVATLNVTVFVFVGALKWALVLLLAATVGFVVWTTVMGLASLGLALGLVGVAEQGLDLAALDQVLGGDLARLLWRHRAVVGLSLPAHQLEVLPGEGIPGLTGVLPHHHVRAEVTEAVAAAAVDLAALDDARLLDGALEGREDGVTSISVLPPP